MIFNNTFKNKKRWLLNIIRKDFKFLLGSLFLGVLAAALGLAMSVFSQKLIDKIIPSHDMNELVLGLVIAGGLVFLKIAVSYIQQYLGIYHNKNFNLRLIDDFYKRVLYLPKTFYDANNTGGVIARMNDSSAIQQTISYIANTLVLNVLTLIVSASVLFFYSVEVGIIALMSFPVYLTIALVFKKRIANKVRAMLEANSRKESNVISTIQNADLVKTHNKQEMFSEINNQTYGEFQTSTFKLGKTGMTMGTLSELVGTFFYILMLSYTSYQTIMGKITIGEFTATLGIATAMLYPIGALGMALLQLQGAKVAFDRLFEFVSLEPEFNLEADKKKEKQEHITNLELKNIFFSYREDVPLLQNVNIKVSSGEMLCIFGKNGSGKSTILNLIMCLYKPSSGNISFNGKDINDLSITSIRDKIAIVSQQSKLFDRTIIENICMETNYLKAKEAIKFLNELGFEPFINKLSDGYDTLVYGNGDNLSGGQKQIISLARALYKKPDILLLDEPTASMDREAEQFVIEVLEKFKKQGIVILVTHRLKPARVCSKIITLENGKIQNIGSHNELLLTENVYSKCFYDFEYEAE